MDTSSNQPIDVRSLLLSKRLEPLSQNQIDTLLHVQQYDVTQFNEADVRMCVVDPILRVLGYDKGTIFSLELENHLEFLGQTRRSDYHATLWRENFWLLEAKRPQIGEDYFSYEHFRQALEYSIHPTVNAALIVLCDGLKFEIFDREISVTQPLLRVKMSNLVSNFDSIRIILEPIQIWFFQGGFKFRSEHPDEASGSRVVGWQCNDVS